MSSEILNVVIIGGGVTGTSLLRRLAMLGVTQMMLIEAHNGVGQVNSHPLNNAQTSHDGGTETNYSLAHALEVQADARLLRTYVDAQTRNGVQHLSTKTNRMVLAVGSEEVAKLKHRFGVFGPHYPDLRLVEREELALLEPKVMENRNPEEEVCALVSSEGYAINYQKLSQCFIEDALTYNPNGIHLLFNTSVESVGWDNEGYYRLITNRGEIKTRVVIFAAGAYSLHFAHMLGYGRDLSLLSIAGSFFSGGKLLNGKVYRVQIEGLPFAAVHGDPDVLNCNDTRFGPTTKPIPFMERHRPETFWDFMSLGLLTDKGFLALFSILASWQLIQYVLKNMLYDLPIIGKWLFLSQVRQIVPSIRYGDLSLRKGAGGVRPQIVNKKTRTLEMGDKTLEGYNAFFITTPSPGASVCMGNANRIAHKVRIALMTEAHAKNRV